MKRNRAGKGPSAANELTLPARSEPVTIVGPRGERIPGRVVDSGSDGVDVALMFPSRKPLSEDTLRQLSLEFTLPRGRVRLQGNVELQEPDLLHLDGLAPVELRQEREYVRVPTSRPVTVTISHGRSSKVHTYSVDLSGGGILLAGPSNLAIGERVPFELSTEKDEQPISGVGVVVRVDGAGRRAIRFEQISDLDRRRLVHFLFESMRLERKRQQGDGHGR